MLSETNSHARRDVILTNNTHLRMSTSTAWMRRYLVFCAPDDSSVKSRAPEELGLARAFRVVGSTERRAPCNVQAHKLRATTCIRRKTACRVPAVVPGAGPGTL